MTDVSIIDSSLSTTPIVSGKSIAAGQRLNYNYEFTMGNENTTIKAIWKKFEITSDKYWPRFKTICF